MSENVFSKRFQGLALAFALTLGLGLSAGGDAAQASDILPTTPDRDGFAAIDAPALTYAALGEQRGTGLDDASTIPMAGDEQKTAVILWDEVKVPNGGATRDSGINSDITISD